MELNINATAAAQRSAFVAPTLGGVWGGLCPELGFRRFDVYTPASALVFGDADMATGHRPWRNLIT
jgi:hypothetical protein